MQITIRHWLLALIAAVVLHMGFFLFSSLQKENQTSLAGGGTQISLDLAGDGQTAAESLQEAAVQSASEAVTPEETSDAREVIPEEMQAEEEPPETMAEATPEETLQQTQSLEETETAAPDEQMVEASEISETTQASEQNIQEAAEPAPQTAQAAPVEESEQMEEIATRSRPEQPPPPKPKDRQLARKPPQQEPQKTPPEEPESAPAETPDNKGNQEEEQAALGESGAGASETTSSGRTRNPGTGQAESADALQRYLGELGLWLERHKDYPRAARQRRQEGTAILRFVIDREGRVLDYSIEQSAGYSLLDREVKAMIERAQPLPAPPDEVQQARLEFRVPLSFRLR